MIDSTSLRIQVLELQRLLESAGDDPILVPQLRERLSDAEKELAKTKGKAKTLFPEEESSPSLVRAAIFLTGGGVEGTRGIKPSLAGEALIQFEKIYVEQAIHEERLAARNQGRQRRPRGAASPGLLLTATRKGSFGLEFAPDESGDPSLVDLHAASLHRVSDTLILLAKSDEALPGQISDDIPTRVIQPIKQFLAALAQHGAGLRFAFSNGPPRELSIEQVRVAAERMEREVQQSRIQIGGVFRGVARESGVFDFRTEGGEVISGNIAEDFSEDDLDRIDQFTNKMCEAEMEVMTIRKLGVAESKRYVLLDLRVRAGK